MLRGVLEGDAVMASRDLTIRIDGMPFWRRTMEAAVDLLAAVEAADPALVTDEIVEAAAALRAVFEEARP